MRKSFQNKSLIINEGIFYGVSLGYDFCAEHEWGIKGMRNHFGIDINKMGLESRTITKGEVLFKEDNTLCVLTSDKPYNLKDGYTAKDLLCYDLKNSMGDLRNSENKIQCAWDEKGFCIASANKEHFGFIKQLYEAFSNKNIAITSISSKVNPFEGTSLCVLIADRLPKKVIDDLYRVDKKAKDLIEYEEKIGVAELKRTNQSVGFKKNKYFMACSPRWIDYEDAKNREEQKKAWNTKYDIQFWINYSDDDDNYGWYTAEQIIKWLTTPDLKLKSLNKK